MRATAVAPATGQGQETAGVAIGIDNVAVTFGGGAGKIRAIDNATLDVREGEFLTLIGHSGCGKSTLLRVVADIIDRLVVAGYPPGELDDITLLAESQRAALFGTAGPVRHLSMV